MAQSEAAGISSSQLHPLPTSSPQRPLPVDARVPTQALAMQENQATVHDFLSLCGTAAGRPSSAAAAPDHVSASQQWSTTQDFLQPLQKSLIPSGSTNNNLRPNGYTLCQSQPYIGSNEPGVGQQSCYAFSNGNFESKENFPSKFRSASISFGSRGNVAHSSHLTKHWQQQAAVEVFDGTKRLSKVPSEEEEDDDDESFEHSYSVKKEGGNLKGEVSQPMEGRNLEKGVTPRSKHSATEQRRRSKINDRFQMLRQLLPNADQKRDKASFLLEVIEYIQMLHEKVKKYEGVDFRGQNQERTKILSWDRTCGPQDVVVSLAQDRKEVSDPNGFVRSRLSPLTAMSEDAITSSGVICSVVQSSALQSVLNFDSKPVLCKSMPLTFSQTTPISIPDQAFNHMHQTSIPDNQTFFSQLLQQEDQATSKVRDLFSQKTDAPQLYVQQSQNMMMPQDSHQLEDRGLPCTSNMDLEHVSALNMSRPEKEPEGQDRAGQVTADFGFCRGKGFNKSSIGLDGRGLPVCSEGSRIEQSTEVMPAKEQEAPTVLGGVINISSTYSQGLLDTLTRALQSSGVDMAQATISVQIDLGKAASARSKQTAPLPIGVSPLQNNQMLSSASVSETPNKRMKLEAD